MIINKTRTLRSIFAASLACSVGASVTSAQQPAPQTPPPPSSAAQALLDTQPETPAELLRAIKILVDLREPAPARPLVEKLLALKPNDAAWSAAIEQHGSAALLRIASAPELAPEGDTLATTALAAAERHARDPQRIAALIGDLKSDAAETRLAAAVALRTGRDAAVLALLAVLADPARASEHEHVRETLALQGPDALPVLHAAVNTPDAALRAQLADVLGQTGDPRAADSLFALAFAEASPEPVRAAAQAALERLFGRVPSATHAGARLYQKAREHFERPALGHTGQRAEAVVWSWDAQQNKPVAETLVWADGELAQAARAARDARAILPDSAPVRRLYLMAVAEQAAYQTGLDKPLAPGPGTPHDELVAAGLDELEEVLSDAMAHGHPAAATAAARLLGEIGSVERLTRHTPHASPLALAARHPDRRVRFAAIEAILKLNPKRPYPGTSYVADALGWFATAPRAPRALVGHVDAGEAGRLAGLMAELGYDAQIAVGELATRDAATAGPEYDVLLIDAALALPGSGALVQHFRRDPRTALAPIAIVARTDAIDRAKRFCERAELCDVMIRPQDRLGLEPQLQRLLRGLDRDPLPAAERQRQAQTALAWIAKLGPLERRLYDLRRLDETIARGLRVPELAPHAAAALASLGTAQSQRSLVNAASLNTLPVEVRQAAVKGFRQSLADHGTLLTTAEIGQQYERYNASEFLDKPTQQVLASILDGIEAAAERVTYAGEAELAPGASVRPK